jgi:hypothetical protein
MASASFVEIISHFAGYLQIFQDIARDRIEYDESVGPRPPDDYTTLRPDYDHPFTPDDLDTLPGPAPDLAPDDPLHWARTHPIKALSNLPEHEPDLIPPSRLPNIPFPMGGGDAGGGGGGSIEFRIQVEYQPGGDQSEIEIHQHNIMYDTTTMLPADALLPADGLTVQLDADAMATIQHMADDANAHIPSDWWIPQTGTGATDFLTAHDANWAANGGMPDANSVQPGYYLNGVLQNPATPAPDLTPLAPPASVPDNGHGLGQWGMLGGNDSINAALIVDLTHSARTMVVMGDYFKTDAMFQTNTTINHDHISVSGGQGTPSITTGDNVANNIADFVHQPGVYSTVPVTYAGPNWSVDVVNGDYYNVHSVVQTNYLMHNNVIAQTSADTHYDLVGGYNDLGNLTQLLDGSIHYDLIVVQGAYHGMNVIFQNNILLNNDQIKMAADGTDPSQSVTAGHNNLLNEGTIEDYGGNSFSPLSANAATIDSLLAGGATSLDPNLGNAIAGNGGTFHVLYITGNYYDVNAVWQTNVTDDVNVIYQLQNQPSAGAMAYHPDGTVTQSVSTGGDRLANDAAIVDVNPDQAYVNGHVYTDSILVQANLLPTHQDNAVNADTHALVPELIAFVNDSQDTTHPAPTTVPAVAHNDPMASMLH